MKRRTLLAVGTGSLLAAPSVIRAQASNGVALVIGNSKYQWEAALPNVRRDAPDIAKRDRKSTRLNSSHSQQSRMPSSA